MLLYIRTRRHKLGSQHIQIHPGALMKALLTVWMLWSVTRALRDRIARYSSSGVLRETDLLRMKKRVRHELLSFSQLVSSGSLNYVANRAKNVNEASIAFFVQISRTNVILVPRLLSRIWHPKNVYCLHFDRKISYHMKEVFARVIVENEHLKNIILLESTVVTYTGISMLLNTLDSIETLLNRDQAWDYYINLSGSDYPLVSPVGIRRLLGQRSVLGKQASFVHITNSRSSWNRLLRHRFRFLHFDPALGFNHNTEEELIQTFQEHPVFTTKNLYVTIPKGEAWIIGHRSLCESIITGNLSRRLLTLFANMQSPVEHFFQTVVWNDRRWNDTTARHSLRLVRWKTAEGALSGQHPVHLDEQSKDGKWLHWNSIKASRDLFARKFRVPNSLLMEHIDKYTSGVGEITAETMSVDYFLERVKRRMNCVLSNTATTLGNFRDCRKRKSPFEPPHPPADKSAKFIE